VHRCRRLGAAPGEGGGGGWLCALQALNSGLRASWLGLLPCTLTGWAGQRGSEGTEVHRGWYIVGAEGQRQQQQHTAPTALKSARRFALPPLLSDG
jgi:hypothetical protein